MKPTSMAFEKRYQDDSGVEFGVSYAKDEVEFCHINEVQFPIQELDWLIECLQKIKAETV